MSLTIAVTGATGMLGGAVVSELRSRGHRVRALVRPESLDRCPEWVTAVPGGLDDAAALDDLVRDSDAIVHLAYGPADAAPPSGRSQAEHFVQTNVVGALRLLERTPATRLQQLVFASTLAVYGDDLYAIQASPGQAVVDEDFPVWPREFYGGHKAALERMIIAGAGDAGMNTSVFRLGCVLGEYRDPGRDELRRVVAEAVQFSEIRSRLGAYVVAATDIARLFAGAIGDGRVRGGVFNTFDRWLDFAELAPSLGAALGRPVEVGADPAPVPRPAISNARVNELDIEWRTDSELDRLIRAAVSACSDTA